MASDVRIYKSVFILMCHILLSFTASAFFGITASKSLWLVNPKIRDNIVGDKFLIQQHSSHHSRLYTRRHSDNIRRSLTLSRPQYPSKILCTILNLEKIQAGICRHGRGVPETLLKAIRLSLLECQHQFRHERWNCTLGPYRRNILQKGFKEASFLYSISSAGLVHEVSRACSQGLLDRCTCDETNPFESRNAWLWGGCGDNVNFGVSFTRRFLHKGRHLLDKDIRAEINLHNSGVGVKVVNKHVNMTCKCHGVSGSCTVRTCWLQLAPFTFVGDHLKRKYLQSVPARLSTNQVSRATTRFSTLTKQRMSDGNDDFLSTKQHAPGRGELVYEEESPNFCRRSRYSPGTRGRTCHKSDGSCDTMCCGRGYNTQRLLLRKSCRCEVIWCCKVECSVCSTVQEIYHCK